MAELLILLIAFTWAGVGGFYAVAADKGIPMLPFVAIVNLSAFVGLSVLTYLRGGIDGLSHVIWPLVLVIALAGIAGQGSMYMMGRAMQSSPKRTSITWTISSMAMIIPFMSGVLLWGEHAAWYRWFALIPMSVSFWLLSRSDDADKVSMIVKGEGSWTIWIALTFGLNGISLCLSQEPSFRGWNDPAGLRGPIQFCAAALVMMVIVLISRARFTWRMLKLGALTGTVVALGNTMMYITLDILSKEGRTYLFFPAAVGGSILFYVVGRLLLGNESLSMRLKIGMGLGIIGVILLSLK